MNPLEQIIVAGNVLAREHQDAKTARMMGLPEQMQAKFIESRRDTRRSEALKQWRNERPVMGPLKPTVEAEPLPIPHELAPPVRRNPLANAVRGERFHQLS